MAKNIIFKKKITTIREKRWKSRDPAKGRVSFKTGVQKSRKQRIKDRNDKYCKKMRKKEESCES